MPLQEETYIEVINSYSIQDWQPLLDLIPEIEATDHFAGDFIEPPVNEDGTKSLPHIFGTEIVGKFLDIVYDMQIIINFDWGLWDEGRSIVNDDNFDFDRIDIPTKCKIITAIVRSDRFCEGALVSCFKSGIILKVLKSIEHQITRNDD